MTPVNTASPRYRDDIPQMANQVTAITGVMKAKVTWGTWKGGSLTGREDRTNGLRSVSSGRWGLYNVSLSDVLYRELVILKSFSNTINGEQPVRFWPPVCPRLTVCRPAHLPIARYQVSYLNLSAVLGKGGAQSTWALQSCSYRKRVENKTEGYASFRKSLIPSRGTHSERSCRNLAVLRSLWTSFASSMVGCESRLMVGTQIPFHLPMG